MKYIKMMCVVVLLGIYMEACSKEQEKKIPSTVQEENKKVVEQTKETPPEKQAEKEKKIEAELPVEQNGEQEKKIEQEPSVEQDEKQELKVEQVPQAEESAKTLEVKGNAEQKQAKFLVVIDPGHQEKANLNLEPIGPGATEQKYKVTDGTTGVVTKKRESVLVLEAAGILKEKLEAKGMQVLMTRTTHDVDISNKERATFANEHQADLFLRLHADGSENRAQKGFAVLTPAEGNTYTKGIYAESLQVSQIIVKKMKENSQVKVNGIKFRDDLSGFNWSKVPGVLLELGFMSNPEEDQKLSDTQYLDSLLQSVTDSVEEYRKSKA
ncbi:N-acetylmuramoyl-L-alanine amidase [Bacillus pseudomycoides]|uniref:N-acetylmuramoyl-L-alanine amidase n=1 Tax=Bacillus pseudomycoides TaxID=64104 RepID=A0A2A8C732_9BACI|nr:N-acetylmuramoyl-L-alanine amidase [Bacillus pseudomycoides]PDY47985.1 N-acetylmuramoyl-L-alanine amidase [Bacillus pseudomycoides]PEM70446.1 N-acetylmuramoyl-L-alanine amidase [Bacillus pseudomycoides]PFZ11118.1 N-acetylmuramoyl-L-alanine amidase [Bacillus pseudomycoides]PGC47530.1 N-acetylmuramoyl-L-alanine amidase [Bacillus pseudomycoides]PGD24988.1 N-acetylmuramoyl-L-alanine amidase [Bacillus pseudomycoides]